MKAAIISACLLFYCFHNTVEAQSSNLPLTKRPLKSTITLLDPSDTIIGALYELKDNSILVSSSLVKEDYFIGNYVVTELHIDNVNLIKQQRRIGQSVFIGAAVGAAAGAVVTRIIIGPPPYYASILGPSEAFFGYALGIPSGALAGAAIGALFVNIKIWIPIKGNIGNYNINKKKLGRYTVQYPGAPTY